MTIEEKVAQLVGFWEKEDGEAVAPLQGEFGDVGKLETGRGTVGEGCDRDDLELPGVQRELIEAVPATGRPVVLVLLTGRPYAVGWR
ncbi:glycoside hydrolase family 3 C-terminal domain-containing protein [Micromonospora endophytica]|uniref:glycoside hydrolase family 3 C-terminal domain-containing protein n=1 Tax=Micromonospora endophytica TaxID=515350 RepID=UPI001C325E45|nr:hypothetical protein Jiend_01780 [Micromonospora endophytica]